MKQLVIIFFVLISSLSYAVDEKLRDYSEEGVAVSDDVVQAKQDAIQDAIEKISKKLIREIIGDTKVDRQLGVVKSKVIAQSDKYIPFIKTGEPQLVGTETHITVQVKVSRSSLESLLQQSGLLSTSEGPAIMLPVVGYFDLVNNKGFKWWNDNPDEANPWLKSEEHAFDESLKAHFSKQGFQVQDPEIWQYRKPVPKNLQQESLRTQDYLSLGENFKSQLVLKGDIKIDHGKTSQSYKLTARLTVLHAGNGRVIADNVRTVETEAGAFNPTVSKRLGEIFDEISQDLASQVQEAWSKGTIGSNLVRVAIKGLNEYQDVENFKQETKEALRVVKGMTERLFARGNVEFDVDVAGGSQELAKAFGVARYKSYQLKVDSVASDRIELSVHR